MNRRKTKKLYKQALAELCREKEYVSAQLGEVQEMHSRAMRAKDRKCDELRRDRDKLYQRVRDLERQQPSLEFPPEGFLPEVAVRDEFLDRRFMGQFPYIRFVAKRIDGPHPYGGADRYRFRLEVDKKCPLEINQIAMLKECFLSLLDYVYNQMNNPTGKTRMRL